MFIIFLLTLAGLADSSYLTWEHYNNIIPPCTIHPLIPAFLIDCGKVLSSPYSLLFGIPLALIGIFHYGLMSFLIAGILIFKKKDIQLLVNPPIFDRHYIFCLFHVYPTGSNQKHLSLLHFIRTN